MSFNFWNPTKIAKLQAAGLTGKPTVWHNWACGCRQGSCDTIVATHHGIAFDPPPGVSRNQHNKNIRRILG